MKPKTPVTPILICIPYWERDRLQATELCKIIAGLQPHHVRNLAHVMLVARQDCAIDKNMVNIISKKFNTFTHKSNSPLKGWPAGPNGMFNSTMIHISNNAPNLYECVYWMEPDAIPLAPNWFWCLVEEWRRRHPQANVVGCRHDCNGDGSGDHISGSCLYHPSIARIMPEITRSCDIAWDYEHRARIVAMGAHTNLIANLYKATNIFPESLQGLLDQGTLVCHGVKDYSVVDFVKKKYNIA